MKALFHAAKAPFLMIRNKIFLLLFINGFILSLVVYFFIEDNYESQIFKVLAKQVRLSAGTDNTDSLLSQSVLLTYNLEQYRTKIFVGKDVSTIKSDLIRPVTYDLLTGDGACGSYSYVLARMLQELGIRTRFAQMQVNGKYGGHILVEAFSQGKWVSLDASYNLIFRKANGQFASFKEVKSDWNYYKGQVPANYDMSYAYAGVQYTNWNKVPVIMPMIKGILTMGMGKEEAEGYSVRNIFLQKFSFLFKLTLGIYILISFFLVRIYLRQSNEIEEFRLAMLFPKKALAEANAGTANIEKAELANPTLA